MSKVYFSKEISSSKILDMYKIFEDKISGNVAVKGSRQPELFAS